MVGGYGKAGVGVSRYMEGQTVTPHKQQLDTCSGNVCLWRYRRVSEQYRLGSRAHIKSVDK